MVSFFQSTEVSLWASELVGGLKFREEANCYDFMHEVSEAFGAEEWGTDDWEYDGDLRAGDERFWFIVNGRLDEYDDVIDIMKGNREWYDGFVASPIFEGRYDPYVIDRPPERWFFMGRSEAPHFFTDNPTLAVIEKLKDATRLCWIEGERKVITSFQIFKV